MMIAPVVLLFASSILAAASPLSSVTPSLPRQSFNHPIALSPPNNEHKFRTKTAQRNMLIALSTVGGSITLAFFIAIIRCISRYKHPPKRDRIAEAIERHNLQSEMEELARNPYALRRPSHREPAPPYIPPPSYSDPLLREGSTIR